jgi:hypothetical protein
VAVKSGASCPTLTLGGGGGAGAWAWSTAVANRATASAMGNVLKYGWVFIGRLPSRMGFQEQWLENIARDTAILHWAWE